MVGCEMENKLKVGDQADNFAVLDQNDEEFRLSDFQGKRILLSFHPLAWTSICAEQMKSLESSKASFDSLNAIAVGISVDSIPSKKAWAESLGITTTRLLADFWPHGKVAQLYGVFRNADGFSERANIIVNGDQRIAYIKIYPIGELPNILEILEFLQS
jgi:peroxiredoxin